MAKRRLRKDNREVYADKLRNKKAIAQSVIQDLESRGYTVPALTKSAAFSTTPARITKKTYKTLTSRSSRLDPTQIRIAAERATKITVDIVRGGGGQEYSIPPTAINLTVYQLKHNPAKQVNEMLRQKVTFNKVNPSTGAIEQVTKHVASEKMSMQVSMLVTTITGKPVKSFKAGYEDELIKIDESWGGSAKTLAEHIKFKKIPYSEDMEQVITTIGSIAYTNPELYEKYREQGAQKSFKSNLPADVDPETAEKLSWILNSSALWNIAQKYAYDSDQVQANYQELVRRINDDYVKNNETILSEVIQMVQNEENIDTIKKSINNLIVASKSGFDDNSIKAIHDTQLSIEKSKEDTLFNRLSAEVASKARKLDRKLKYDKKKAMKGSNLDDE